MSRLWIGILLTAIVCSLPGCGTAPSPKDKCPGPEPREEAQTDSASQAEPPEALDAKAPEQKQGPCPREEVAPKVKQTPAKDQAPATLPVKLIAPANARVVVSSMQFGGETHRVDRYRVFDLAPGTSHKVEVALPDGKALTGRLEIPETACQPRRAILPVVISESHVIRPALQQGKRVTYVVYERVLPHQDTRPLRLSRWQRLNPKWWFLTPKQRALLEAELRARPKPLSPRVTARPYSANEWARVAKDSKYFLNPVTPASDAVTVPSEAEARKRLVFYNMKRDAKRGYDPVVRDEIEAKARGGGYLYPYAKSEERLDVAQLDNLSSRAVPAALWRAAARGPDENVRHIVGYDGLTLERAKLRGNVLVVLRLRLDEPAVAGAASARLSLLRVRVVAKRGATLTLQPRVWGAAYTGPVEVTCPGEAKLSVWGSYSMRLAMPKGPQATGSLTVPKSAAESQSSPVMLLLDGKGIPGLLAEGRPIKYVVYEKEEATQEGTAGIATGPRPVTLQHLVSSDKDALKQAKREGRVLVVMDLLATGCEPREQQDKQEAAQAEEEE